MLHVTDHRRRRFLQYNFMDPGWEGGGRISYGGAGPLLPPLAPALGRFMPICIEIGSLVFKTWRSQVGNG